MSNVCTAKVAPAAATTVIYAGPCIYYGSNLTAAAAAGTLTVWDNATAASGSQVDAISVAVNTTQWTDHSVGIMCNNGLTVVTTGAAAAGIVKFIPSA